MRTSDIVAVADLHGHLDHLKALRSHLAHHVSNPTLVLLGDYCDNGPAIPELIDALIALKDELGERLIAIAGNHDIACLRALGWPTGTPDTVWYDWWSSRYWNPGLGTATAYGADSAESLRSAMPTAHREFLTGLPWVAQLDAFVFVHCGMHDAALGPQIDALERKELPAGHTHLPAQLRDKSISRNANPTWTHTVVSGHNKAPGGSLGRSLFAPKRICLAADVDVTGNLRAVGLKSGTQWVVHPDLSVSTQQAMLPE